MTRGALAAYETAFALDPHDARVFFELDQLYKKLNRRPLSDWRGCKRMPHLVSSATT